MGLGGISPWSLILILAIVLLLFGTKRLRNIGSDLGGAFSSFKKAVKDEGDVAEDDRDRQGKVTNAEPGRVIDAEARQKDKV